MNIAEILKDCPKGTKLYSPLFGECELVHVDCINTNPYPIIIRVKDAEHIFSKDGLFYKEYINGECMLFPSKENRDWSTFKLPKKCEFKPFDRVLVRDCEDDIWKCGFFSHYQHNNCYDTEYYYYTTDTGYKRCIPYEGNEHLLGTTNNPR